MTPLTRDRILRHVGTVDVFVFSPYGQNGIAIHEGGDLREIIEGNAEGVWAYMRRMVRRYGEGKLDKSNQQV